MCVVMDCLLVKYRPDDGLSTVVCYVPFQCTLMTPSGEGGGGGEGGNEGGGEGLEGEVSRTSQALLEEERISEGWDKTVHTHLLALASSPVETLWPKDTLFRYIPTDSHSPCQHCHTSSNNY